MSANNSRNGSPSRQLTADLATSRAQFEHDKEQSRLAVKKYGIPHSSKAPRTPAHTAGTAAQAFDAAYGPHIRRKSLSPGAKERLAAFNAQHAQQGARNVSPDAIQTALAAASRGHDSPPRVRSPSPKPKGAEGDKPGTGQRLRGRSSLSQSSLRSQYTQ